MYAVIAFALIAVASAVPAISYGSYGVPAYGVQRAYGYAAPAVVQKAYGYAAPAVVQKVVAAPHAYAAHSGAIVERDYNIEQIGERHGVNAGPVQFQYSFVKGVDSGAHIAQKIVAPHAYAQKIVASPVAAYAAHPAAYGVHGIQQVYAAGLRAGPVVQKVNPFAVKQLY